MRRLHALLGDLEVHAGAVGKFFAGAFEHFFKFLFGSGKFLLVKESQSLVVELQLRLDAGINQFDTAALGRLAGVKGFFFCDLEEDLPRDEELDGDFLAFAMPGTLAEPQIAVNAGKMVAVPGSSRECPERNNKTRLGTRAKAGGVGEAPVPRSLKYCVEDGNCGDQPESSRILCDDATRVGGRPGDEKLRETGSDVEWFACLENEKVRNGKIVDVHEIPHTSTVRSRKIRAKD